MSTVRLQVRDAVIDALNDARAPEIPVATKRRWIPGESNRCPSVGVFFVEEQNTPVGGRHGSLVERGLQIAVQCVNATSDPAESDDSVEPLLAHVVERIGRTNLDGLILDTTELGTKWEAAKADLHYIAATMFWAINFQTKRNDLGSRQ